MDQNNKNKTILVTGGAGFIGSFLVDRLINLGHHVKIFDNLDPQVHPVRGRTRNESATSNGVHPLSQKPKYLNPRAEFIFGDVRNYDDLKSALSNVDVVFHKAAAVGVAQSQYQIKKYIDTNVGGAANLADILINEKHKIKKVIVASSMTVYGEGNYNCVNCGAVRPKTRSDEEVKKRGFRPCCPKCEGMIKSVSISEDAEQCCENIYALSKRAQENVLMNVGKTYGIPIVAFRYFNVYGPRQSLSNPYTGVAAIFINRFKNNRSPVIYEDGKQTRDFISVHDVVEANVIAMKNNESDYEVFNIGSGIPFSIEKIAKTLSVLMNSDVNIDICRQFRKGDIRHCFADISKAKNKLGWKPKISFLKGMKELIEWSQKEAAEDKTDKAAEELKQKGLV